MRAVVLSAVRTPIGRYAGALSGARPDDLAGIAIAAAVERAAVDGGVIDGGVIDGSGIDGGGIGDGHGALLVGGVRMLGEPITLDRGPDRSCPLPCLAALLSGCRTGWTLEKRVRGVNGAVIGVTGRRAAGAVTFDAPDGTVYRRWHELV